MTNVEAAINWMASRQGRVSYSMSYRYGPNSYDCSSAVYNALASAGWKTSANGRNTETMFADLTALGWSELPRRADGGYDAKRGDIFIWGASWLLRWCLWSYRFLRRSRQHHSL